MSFLGLYRDPVVARVTRRCDWRISDFVDNQSPTTLYLVVPPSDISRTKPLIRLVLNQIGRRLTEELDPEGRKQRLLLLLDEFPALGRLDFFELALAFMAGYGLKSFLIAQSLNQIEKAYGPNHAILDNCHVRVAFATNDERTARRVSDALGMATELRAMKNYAGHRLSPWLGHLMVSRQETARPLLTAGEVMQLPPTDELVFVSGVPPIRAKKARYYEDRRLAARILPPPSLEQGGLSGRPASRPCDWKHPPVPSQVHPVANGSAAVSSKLKRDQANAGIRREPALPEHEFDRPQKAAPRVRRERGRTGRRGCARKNASAADEGSRPTGGDGAGRRHQSLSERGVSMKARMNVYFEPELLQKVDELVARRHLSKSLIIEAAVSSFLSPDAEDRREAAFSRRLDRLIRQNEQLERHLVISSEALALFVRFWLTVTPPMPESAQGPTRTTGSERYQAFIEALGRRVAKGHSLLHDVTADIGRSPAAHTDDAEDQ